MAVSSMPVALSSAPRYDKKIVVTSVPGTYLGLLPVDHFIFGLSVKRKVCILSPKVDEIIVFILHSGALSMKPLARMKTPCSGRST